MQPEYIVPKGMEPTDEQIRQLARMEYAKLVKQFAGTMYEMLDSEEYYIKDNWGTFRRRLEMRVATPVDTTNYTNKPSEYGDVMTVADWVESCVDGFFIDYDGYGAPMKGKLVAKNCIVWPSIRHLIPKDATHIEWYNR